MDAAYWNRQPLYTSAAAPKRQRTETAGALPGQEAQIFLPQDDHASIQAMKDTGTLGASYDRYLQNTQQFSSYGFAQAGSVGLTRPIVGEMSGFRGVQVGLPYQNHLVLAGPGFRSLGPPVDPMVRSVLPERERPLPPDASSTLFVEGLPRDTTEREIAHIFRPFIGYKEVRLVKKEPKYDGGSPFLLCFVDFTTPSNAMAAMNAVEGYMMDLNDPDSSALRLQFAKFTARKPSHGFHGKRGDRGERGERGDRGDR